MDFLVENMVTKKELDYELGEIRKEMATKEDLKFELGEIRKEMATKDDLGKMRSEMIDFIDKRLLNLKTDLVVIVKGEDQKLTALIELMTHKELLTPSEARGIIQMNPLAPAA
jgi:hypothetical protein